VKARMRSVKVSVTPTGLVALFLGIALTAQAQPLTRTVIGYSAIQAPVVPLWLAEEQGLFKKYGLDPRLVFIRTTSVHMAGLISGQIDISYGGATGVLPTVGSGVDLKFIATLSSRLTHVLVVRPEIQRPRNLQGNRVGVSIGGTQWITTKLGLEHLEVDEQRNAIRLLAIGDQSVLRTALEAGSIEAAFLNGAMAEELKAKGFRVLVDLHGANIKTVGSGIIVKAAEIQKSREPAMNVLKAVVEGLAFVKSPARKSTVLKTLMNRLRLSDLSVAEEGYRYLQRDLDVSLVTPLEGLQNLQRFMRAYSPRLGDINVAQLIDNSFISSLAETGFLEKTFAAYGVK
jgi:NitT/TauT family transport system substrate-binding protein